MLTRHRRKTLLLFDGADTTVDPAESSFSFDDYDITANSSSTATASIVARNAAGETLSGKTVTLAIETIAVSAANSLVTCSPAEIADDGADTVTITVQVKDASGRPIPDIPAADVVLASTGSGNTITQPTGSTNQQGQISGSMVSTVAAAKTLSATVRGTAITDTATVTVSGTPPAGFGFDNEPVGMTMVAEWNDEATVETADWVFDGGSMPGPTGGTTTRVTSGYPDTPVVGGTAVIYNQIPGGSTGGFGPGRLVHNFVDGVKDEFYFALEGMVTAANTTSTASGGNKIALLYFDDGVRYFLNFDDGSMAGNWGIYQQSTLLVTGTQPLTYGERFVVEWYMDRSGGAGAGIMQLWVNGVLAVNETALTITTSPLANCYKEWTNNGNRTTASPVTRVIGEHAGADTTMESWISAMKVSTR